MSAAGNMRIRVAALIVEDGRLLMVEHEKDGARYWLLPGGGVDYGETLERALERELWEETRLRVQVGNLVLVNDSIAPDGARHVVQMCFTAQVLSGTPEVGSDARVVQVAYVPFDAVPELPMYPAMQEEVVRVCREGFPEHAMYLGNIWT